MKPTSIATLSGISRKTGTILGAPPKQPRSYLAAWWRVSVFFALLILAATPLIAATLPVGIPRQLAAERARQISEVRYHLSYALSGHATDAPGHEELRFRLRHNAEVIVDFRGGILSRVELNGTVLPNALENGHFVLPASVVREGDNALIVDFSAPIAPAGKALTRYDDKDDGSEYIYTLFVPMDASMAFPCFDQPDLKGRFRLDVTTPSGWKVVSNAPIENTSEIGDNRRRSFGETRPISTYLFAFAAGPFENIHPASGLPNVYARRSQIARAEAEVPQIQSVTSSGMRFLSEYFAEPFPFPKYEMVLLPGFAYGGMEHAGCTFLREESMLFRTAPTETDRFYRSITILHELTHQWFGDFVTMRWFDDLWLKEGFAQYMAFRAMATLQPSENVWKRFYQSIKPAAYGIDVTQGTTPIYQDISNLADAKSAYGAIVYSKAPGLLRQLGYLLGDERFRDGLRIYLRDHAYGNAEWNDLVHALEEASHRRLGDWARDWIRRRGMPEVRASWSCDASAQQLTRLTLTQKDVLGGGEVWPIATQILLGYHDREPIRLRADFSSESASIRAAAGQACPDYVFANDEDYAYGMFLLDERSRSYTMAHLASISDLFRRTLLWGAFWDAVRFAELAPRSYLALSLDRLPGETDEALIQSVGAHAATALHDYVDAKTRQELDERFEQIAIGGMLHSSGEGLRIMWFRNLRSVADDSTGLVALRRLLDGTLRIPGVELRQLDRWSLVTSLIAHADSSAAAVFQAEQQRDHTGEGLKYAYMAQAAKPDAATKRWYFNDYVANVSRPEDWVEQSLGPFNYWNESELTMPYLRPALEALPQIKRERKIFFVLSWLSAFIDGQNSEHADEEVHRWLAGASVDHDLELKVLQMVDNLDRIVKIRRQFP